LDERVAHLKAERGQLARQWQVIAGRHEVERDRAVEERDALQLQVDELASELAEARTELQRLHAGGVTT
jgi:hypothetical protein